MDKPNGYDPFVRGSSPLGDTAWVMCISPKIKHFEVSRDTKSRKCKTTLQPLADMLP